MSERAAAHLVRLMLISMVVQLLMIGYVLYQSYQGRVDLVTSQRAGCERGKLDRADNAAFQKAQTVYISHVTGAASVKADVKSAARQAKKTFSRTSARLIKRSRIDCSIAFPKASFLP